MINELIKKIRVACLLDQKEFGARLGVTAGTICNYEKGSRRPRMKTIRDILVLAKEGNVRAKYEDFIE